MAEYTRNLNLIKPAVSDTYNIEDFNRNADKLDTLASRPNLLLNSNFKINQKGASSYSTHAAITVDRYRIISEQDAAISVDLSDTAVFLNITPANGAGTTSNLSTTIPTEDLPVNEWYSLSCEYTYLGEYNEADFTALLFYCDYTHFNHERISLGNNRYRHTVSLFVTAWHTTFVLVQIMRANAFTSVRSVQLHNCKLEIGEHSTAYVDPDPLLEFLKCQQYYFIEGSQIAYNPPLATTHLISQHRFPVPMAAVPIVTILALDGTLNGITRWDSQQTMPGINAAVNTATLNEYGFSSVYVSEILSAGLAVTYKYIAEVPHL